MQVAVLGTGTMGTGMAHSLLREGHHVRVWNRTAGRARPLRDDGAIVAESAREAVDGADAVITMLFDTEAVLQVAQEFAPGLRSDGVWLQTSTIGLEGIGRVSDLARHHGLRLLDAPVLGTKAPAEQGELVVLASGDPAARAAARPVLDAIGRKTVWAGDTVGAASALKLAGNAWIAAITAATAQSLAFAAALGLDPTLFLDAIDGGASDTPYAHVKGADMLSGSYEPSFALDGILKDLDLIRSAAGGGGSNLRLIDALIELYAQASADGHGDDDIAAVYAAFDPH
jgi:3-hydroxyisobutyrate dehydrogenase